MSEFEQAPRDVPHGPPKPPGAWRRADVLVATVLINLFSLALPVGILQVYDRVLPNHSTDTFTLLIIALILVAVLDGMLRIARSMVLSWSGARYEFRESIKVLKHVLHSDLVRFNQSTVSTHLDQNASLERIREFYSSQSILMLVDLPFVVLFLCLIWMFSGPLVLIPLSVMLGFMVMSFVAGGRLRRAFNEQHLVDRRKQDFVLEVLGGIHTVKALAMEQQVMRRYERLQAKSAEAVAEVSRLSSVVQGLGSTLSQGVIVSFVAVGSIAVVANELTVGGLAAGTMLAGRVLQPSLKAMGLWTQLQTLFLARDRLRQAYEAPLDVIRDGAAPVKLNGSIALENIHFKHGNDDPELLCGVDLDVKPGETIGITGKNGAGKSTLINILMGFMRPSEGRVILDGTDIRDLDRSSVRAQIGLMPQQGVMLQGTILENMTMFREGEAVDQAIALAKAIGLDKRIMQLPDGLDTKIGGAQFTALSEGVRQLIVLVRSLVGNPDVIVFDDAGSALDLEHDIMLTSLLNRYRGTHTMILVSHRPSMLRICDRCYRLQQGVLVPDQLSVVSPASRAPARPAAVPSSRPNVHLVRAS